MPSMANVVAIIPATNVINFLEVFGNSTAKPNDEEYRLLVFVVHCAKVNTKIAGIPKPSVIKITIKSSVPRALDNIIAMTSIKLLPIKKPKKAARIASFLDLAHRAISGEIGRASFRERYQLS